LAELFQAIPAGERRAARVFAKKGKSAAADARAAWKIKMALNAQRSSPVRLAFGCYLVGGPESFIFRITAGGVIGQPWARCFWPAAEGKHWEIVRSLKMMLGPGYAY